MDESPKSVMISSISSVVKHLSGAKSPRSVETAKELEHVKQSERSVLENTAPKHSGPRPKFIPDTDCSLLLRPLYPLVANQRQNGFGVLRIQVGQCVSRVCEVNLNSSGARSKLPFTIPWCGKNGYQCWRTQVRALSDVAICSAQLLQESVWLCHT